MNEKYFDQHGTLEKKTMVAMLTCTEWVKEEEKSQI